MSLKLRYMQNIDIPSVVEIDRQAFKTPWSSRSYAYEINESNYSHMVVLERQVKAPVQGWKKLVRSITNNGNNTVSRYDVLGYGGLWRIMEEAHISTIATARNQRGNGYGEVLLAGMIRRALTLQAGYVVLEVRVSNTTAQNLYKKYEFEVADVKANYYRDDGEDAYDMRLDLGDEAMVSRFYDRFAQVKARHGFEDTYTNVKRTTP